MGWGTLQVLTDGVNIHLHRYIPSVSCCRSWFHLDCCPVPFVFGELSDAVVGHLVAGWLKFPPQPRVLVLGSAGTDSSVFKQVGCLQIWI